MSIDPITVQLIEYRAITAGLLVVPPLLLVATIEAALWTARAVVRIRVRK